MWAPDIAERAGVEHQRKWRGFAVPAHSFPGEFDSRFSLWARRILGGSWDVENGPLTRLKETLAGINALTEEGIGKSLFKAETSSKLLFPNAENDGAYRDAHSALYGLVIDGLDKETIAKLAGVRGMQLRLDNNNTIAALKKVITEPTCQDAIFAPLETVSSRRRAADHGAQPVPSAFPAFDRFSSDVEAVVAGMLKLREYVEATLNLEVQQCLDRRESKSMIPQFDTTRRSEARYSICHIQSVVGKTIEKVEYGFRAPIAGVHDSELIILQFTDGSMLSISTGSNAGNLSDIHDGLKAEHFHSSFALIFVPPARPSSSPASSD